MYRNFPIYAKQEQNHELLKNMIFFHISFHFAFWGEGPFVRTGRLHKGASQSDFNIINIYLNLVDLDSNELTSVWKATLIKSTAWKVSVFEVFWSVFSRIRTEYGEIRSISSYSVRMRENTDQINSEYGNFSRSDQDQDSYW